NIPFDEAKRLERKLKKQRGMSDVVFTSRGDDQEDFIEHYNNGSALFDITFDYDEDDERSLECLEEVQKELSDYDIYISTSLGDQDAENLAQEMKKIIVIVAFVVVGVLLFTCQSFGEVPVLLITFLSAMILNNGTNFLFGTISYVSNSVSSILQLALSLDYAIILNNHYKEERTRYGVRDASVVALSVSIPEICASSLTTISGMFAMVFMQFGIGKDLGIILIKAILLSLLSVFTLMPGLLVMFAGAIERLEHKNFVPKINRI
ncbi:MAG: MMPL family transporter, partial [Lachnospiraceae bacterium]|nr:MMPL family transporter [Lachnospiraceae bacterium]